MQCLIVLFALSAAVSAQYYPFAAYAPALRTQYHAQDSLGQYSFGYSGGPSSKQESSAGGVTQGAFSYVDAHGLVQSRSYVADPVNGFRVAGSDIPVDANTPIAHVAAHPLAILARKRRQVAVYSAAPAVYSAPAHAVYSAAPAVYAAPHAVAYTAPAVYSAPAPAVYAAPSAVAYAAAPSAADTPEVAAAKIAHYQQYNHESLRNSHLASRKKRSVYAYAAPIAAPVAPIAYHAASIAAPIAPLAYAAPVAAPLAYATPVAHAAPVATSSQYHAQDELGQYSYGYSNPLSSKAESRSANGVTQGGYSYVDAHGLVQSASYVSDPANGFRVAATNLPVAPVAA